MELSKSYLETVSMSELLNLADLYGIYIPEGLSREFIIGEFLEYANEDRFLPKVSMVEVDDVSQKDLEESLPKTYEVTTIHLLLKDPMWVFAFWDFNSHLFETTVNSPEFETFFLRVVIIKKHSAANSHEFYDIDISVDDRKRYVHLSFNDEICRIDLCMRFGNENIKVLAQSNVLELARQNIQNRLCISQNNANPIIKLSGLKLIKSSHFKNFRQAFRNENE